MAQNYTNEYNIDLPLAIWLLQDGYNSGAENAPEGELISVTTLLKPTRQLILQRKVDYSEVKIDISELIASRIGQSIHDSIEKSWTEGDWKSAMKKMHFPNNIIDKIIINPDPKKVTPDQIPIYLEYRGYKKFDGVVITGQGDFLIGTAYRDFKTTSTFSYMDSSKDDDYILQGSMYRWIMPELIKDDVMRIEFIFTDYVKYMVKSNPNYPQAKVTHKEYPLMSHAETEKWVKAKLNEIRANAQLSQNEMIRCSDKELWRGKDSFKYYTDPNKAKEGARCTKRFNSESDAEIHKQTKGKGIIIKDPGLPKKCTFCPAFPICEQRKEYFQDDGTYH